MIKSSFAILSALAVLMPDAASAYNRNNKPCCRSSDQPKWYAGIEGSIAFLGDTDLGQTFVNTPTGNSFDSLSYDPGLGFGGMVGYRIYPNISVEGEVMLYENDLDKLGPDPYTAPSGYYSAQKSISVMGNLMYTYYQTKFLHPYFGAGAGMVNAKSPFFVNSGSERIKLRDWLMGYQFKAGLAYDIGDTPLEMNVGYRYLTTEEGEKSFSSAPNTKFHWDNTSHSIDVGLKLNF